MVEGDPFNLVWSDMSLKCTGCHAIQLKLMGQSTGKVDVFNLTATCESPSLVTSGLSFTSVRTAGDHWLADPVHPFGIQHAVFGRDRLKLMP